MSQSLAPALVAEPDPSLENENCCPAADSPIAEQLPLSESPPSQDAAQFEQTTPKARAGRERSSETSASSGSESGTSKTVRLGVCAMDRKARSKPMRNILSRLIDTGSFEVIIFGDKVLLDDPIEHWPVCDVLITFFSAGFPMDKAIRYVNLRQPVCVNDLPMQKVFWDRRVVLMILDKVGVRTPKRLIANRDGGPRLDPQVAHQVSRELGLDVNRSEAECQFSMPDDDTILINGKKMVKPFVEKPFSGEDHNVHIYFKSKDGGGLGGGRKLFRKVGNKSSEHDPNLVVPRQDATYVYEEFIDVENAEDIKVYTLGPNFVHAETRKSPVVDGVVRRNNEGKEIRYICQLTKEERHMASVISRAFKQNICGFDLLRANGRSYVIDVNGWSFVKGNDFYYDKCAEILSKFCLTRVPLSPSPSSSSVTQNEPTSWRLHATITTFRHADRTPKMKLKFPFKGHDPESEPFIRLLQGRKAEVILRQPEQLEKIVAAAEEAAHMPGADLEKLEQLQSVISDKVPFSGTKAQIKPDFNKETGECEKVNVVVKWGGETTHSARHQSRDLAENFRKDLVIMNKSLLDHTTVFTSSERRCIATAEVFTSAFLDAGRGSGDGTEPAQQQMIVRKDLLDDSNSAKAPMDDVKKRLKELLRPGEYKKPDFHWQVPNIEPQQVVVDVIKIMAYLRDTLETNWKKLDVDKIQSRWCCGETPIRWRERWIKLFGDFCDVPLQKFDPARVSELYDSLKYDALHNRVFLTTIFTLPKGTPAPDWLFTMTSAIHRSSAKRTHQSTLTAAAALELEKEAAYDANRLPRSKEVGREPTPDTLRLLYTYAKELFDFIGPQEYGITKKEKREISLLTSWPLLNQIEKDLRAATTDAPGCATFYFTKESHIQTLINLVLLSDLKIVMPRCPELDYMAYMEFEVFERMVDEVKEFSVRIVLSEGAHGMPLDIELDAKHALQVQPRRVLTDHVPLDKLFAAIDVYAKDAREHSKAAAPIEGMLLEGDALFGDKTINHDSVNLLSFTPDRRSRPNSVGGSTDDLLGQLNGARSD